MYVECPVPSDGAPCRLDAHVRGSGRGRKWMDETDLPTQRAQARQDARLSQADVDQGRTGCHQVAPCEGASAPVGVTSRTAARGLGPVRSRRTYAELRKPTGRGRAGPVTVSFLDRPEWDRPEVAYAVNRKVGSAVERNLLRRRMRSILRERPTGLLAGAYLVRCGPEGPALDFHELKVAMSQALEKATTGASRGTSAPTRPSPGTKR